MEIGLNPTGTINVSSQRVEKVEIVKPDSTSDAINDKYFMGYFKWYGQTHGWLSAIYNFFSGYFVRFVFYQTFYAFSLGATSFFMRKYVFSRVF